MDKDIELLTNEIRKKIIDGDDWDFDEMAKTLYGIQIGRNQTFSEYVKLLGNPSVKSFLPISAFKHHEIKTGSWSSQHIFKSSGTTESISSKHHVKDVSFYHEISRQHFESIFGEIKDVCILALLPHYLERGESSLVSMVGHFIQKSEKVESGFYLYDYKKLKETILSNEKERIPTVLFGVTYALLDFIEFFGVAIVKHLTVVETGGMKGKGKELTREELHATLSFHFKSASITSEYGMTELFSQAYLKEDGWFYPGKTMKLKITEINDPFTEEKLGKTGVVNIVDLANIDTCSFIMTQDLGRMNEEGGFQIMGRLDYSDLRGCNLMVQDL